MVEFFSVVFGEKETIALEVLVVTNDDITAPQFFDKIGVLALFDSLYSLTNQTHKILLGGWDSPRVGASPFL